MPDKELVTIRPDDEVARLNVSIPGRDSLSQREDEINARRATLEAEIGERRQEYKALAQELDQIATTRSAAKKVSAMSPAERRLLGIPEPQAVAPTGIESEESVKGLAS